MKVLVVDVGGSKVKFKVWRRSEKREFPSGKGLTPKQFVAKILEMTSDWNYDAISIGFPGQVIHGRAAADPPNLGKGWIGFDFEKAFKKPTRIINDATMQAVGSYRGGRMLFIGLGTGVGSALILDDVIIPLELGELGYSDGKLLWQVLGKAGLEEVGVHEWEKAVTETIQRFAAAFRTDYVIVGGGNQKKLARLPKSAQRGHNDLAFTGGARLWTGAIGGFKAKPRKHTWVIT